MQAQKSQIDMGVKCNVLPLNFVNGSPSKFLWLKSSIHQKTLVAKNQDGSFSILTVKNKGSVYTFVLDPNLRCVFWDSENASQSGQLLFAQASNEDILLYGVDEVGVTEILHVARVRLLNIFKTSLSVNIDWTNKSIKLVGCDQGQLILHICDFGLFSVVMTTGGNIYLQYTIPLPKVLSSFDVKSDSRANMLVGDTISCYQIVNGTVVIIDPHLYLLFIYLLTSGHCVSQLDLRPLCIEMNSIVSWQISHDLKEVMLLLNNWLVICINIESYSIQHSSYHNLVNSRVHEQAFNQKYLSFNLCAYGDVTWKHEVVNHNINLSDSKVRKVVPSLTTRQPTGFRILQCKAQKDNTVSSKSLATSYKSALQLLVGEQQMKWKLEAMTASSSVLTLVLSRQLAPGEKKEQAICFANFTDSSVHLHHLPDTTSVVLSSSPTSCHMLMSHEYLIFLSSDVRLQKDDLISWIMSYSGPNIADSVCQANQWTRAAIPLNTLEASLKQRQLDTLAFYFKSKKSLFSTTEHSSILASEMRQLDDVLKLVALSITSSLADTQGRMFAERLLSLSVDFVYGLLEDAHHVSQNGTEQNSYEQSRSTDRDVVEWCSVILSHLPTLRRCMCTFQYKPSPNKSVVPALNEQKAIETKIDSNLQMNLENSVQDNCISSYQAMVMSIDTNKGLHYRDLVAELLNATKQHLERRDISSCQNLFNNLGCDATATIWSLGQFYASRSLQQFVTSQLSTASALVPRQRQVMQYVEQVYNVYPCASFNTAMRNKVEDKNGTWPDKEDPLQETVFASDTFLLSHCGELIQENICTELSTNHGGPYAAFLLAWVDNWSEDMKQAVLLDAHFLSSGDGVKSDSSYTCSYLISHNLLTELLILLKSASTNTKLTVPMELTDFLYLGWSHLRKELARELLRLGQLNIESAFSQDIDICALLPSVGDIMKKPHPLSYIGPTKIKRLHFDFITSCITAGLQLPLWVYCSVHCLSLSEIEEIPKCSWLPLFQAMYSIPRHPTDETVVLAASLRAASDLWATSCDEASVELMLEKNQILAAVGTLCYMSETHIDLNVSTLERCLVRFPKLVLALLPDGHELSTKLDTTVYQLLMGTASFDLRRLFGWHTRNVFAREDSPKVMPNFSESHLKIAHSRHQKLLFPYYLKHGRPVFAFLSFLSEELNRGEATLSHKRVQQACGAALWIACENFETSYISSACVVFVELLGRNSAHVRSMIHAGRLLFAHRHKNVSGGAEAKKEQLKECVAEIVSELQACVRSRHRHGHKFIKSLETVIMEEIKLEGVESCSFEASNKWMLVVILCKLLGLPLSVSFLQSCAENDNWFMFVWFAQLHQYPAHQLQLMLHSFKSGHVRDHLYYVLNNADCKLFSSIPSTTSSTLIGSDNERSNQSQRTSLYNKIGLQRTKVESTSDDDDDDDGDEAKSGHIVISSFSSRLKQTEFTESEMPESTAPEDVFTMLFYSSSMPSQWKCLLAASVSLGNPLFAELAACCGCPAIPSLCGWLLASLNPEMKQNLLSEHGQQVSKWTIEQLETVIHAMLVSGQEDSLTTAFIILQPQSPLIPFLGFITECVKRGNYASSKTFIDQFKDAMASSDSQQTPQKIASDLPAIGNRSWVEKITYDILKFELSMVGSLYHARHLLQILDKQNLCLVFSFDVMDFAQLHKVIKILHTNSVPNLHLPSLLTSATGSRVFNAQCEAAVKYLIQCSQFSQANKLAKVSGISQEKATLSQLREEKRELVKCGAWTAKFVRAQYWSKSVELIQQADCHMDSVAMFFQEELQGTTTEFEKAILCQHWFVLLENNTQTPEVASLKDAVFREMWRHRIVAKVALEEIEPLDEVFDEVNLSTVQQGDHKTDLLHVTVMSLSASDTHDLGAQELEVLDSLMGSYLDKGHVSACTEVAAVFGHYNQDLAIIQTCIVLATRQNSVDNIEPAMKRLIAKSCSKRVRAPSITLSRSFSITSISSTVSSLTDASSMSQSQEVISVMEKLYVHCDKGSEVCLRIITCYKIAEILALEYKDVVMNSPFDSLRQLLKIHDPYKFALARDFLATSGLSDNEVTGFLADSIVEVLKVFVKGNLSDLDLQTDDEQSEWMFNPSDGMEIFSQFLQLCENVALLGDHILQAVTSLLSSGQQDISTTALTIQTELIIMSHECYTVSSNMEGISHVLRAARVCCDCITEAREFTLMIRLLTGVGRYSEMLYIFHALQQHHQFELLLRRGMDREDKLKVAILDYLKRYQPDDNEAYTMVALKFTMYRDIAGMLETCGHRTLKLLKDKTIDNSKEIQQLLRKCLQYFKDAAESYVKDNSVRKAQTCVRQARLLSLQLQFVAVGITIINLNRDQLAAFVNTHGRFIEAMVVSDAYDRRADWTEALYNNVVINGDMCYLQEMRLHVHITPALVEDVVKRYKQVNTKTSTALTAIKKLLALTKDAQLQYRLASDLGLADMVTAMFKGDTSSYLQDITVV